MEVTLKFDAGDPKSLTVLAALTAALTATSGAIATPTSRNGQSRTTSPVATTATSAPDGEDVAIEKVRETVLAKSQGGKKDEVKALLKKFGAGKVTDLKKEQYADFLKEAEEL